MNGVEECVGLFSITDEESPSTVEPRVEPIIPLIDAETILPKLATSSPDFSRAGTRTTKIRRLRTTSTISTSAACVSKIYP